MSCQTCAKCNINSDLYTVSNILIETDKKEKCVKTYKRCVVVAIGFSVLRICSYGFYIEFTVYQTRAARPPVVFCFFTSDIRQSVLIFFIKQSDTVTKC